MPFATIPACTHKLLERFGAAYPAGLYRLYLGRVPQEQVVEAVRRYRPAAEGNMENARTAVRPTGNIRCGAWSLHSQMPA